MAFVAIIEASYELSTDFFAAIEPSCLVSMAFIAAIEASCNVDLKAVAEAPFWLLIAACKAVIETSY